MSPAFAECAVVANCWPISRRGRTFGAEAKNEGLT